VTFGLSGLWEILSWPNVVSLLTRSRYTLVHSSLKKLACCFYTRVACSVRFLLTFARRYVVRQLENAFDHQSIQAQLMLLDAVGGRILFHNGQNRLAARVDCLLLVLSDVRIINTCK